jgi:hypothetical protein
MTGNVTLARLHDWQSSLYRGNSGAIDGFLTEVESKLPMGWKRDPREEQRYALPVRYYIFDQPNDALIGVLLRNTTKTRVRGDTVRVYRNPPGPTERIGVLVAELADKCVLPAAKAVGVEHSRPRFGVRSVVTPAIESMLNQLADDADCVWPLPANTKDMWDDLISMSLAEHIALDRTEFQRWATDSGWSAPAASELVERFFADSLWLAKRLAVASQ